MCKDKIKDVFYAYASLNVRLHVIEINKDRTLCGIDPPSHWEMSFQGEPYAEIGKFLEKEQSSMRPGFCIGRSFAPDRYFCKKCYNSLKKRLS